MRYILKDRILYFTDWEYAVGIAIFFYLIRQSIVEHPFGTIKRNWGYTYTLLRSKKKVKGEIALIGLCYNFKRAMNIIGKEELKKAMEAFFNQISIFMRFVAIPQPTE